MWSIRLEMGKRLTKSTSSVVLSLMCLSVCYVRPVDVARGGQRSRTTPPPLTAEGSHFGHPIDRIKILGMLL